ncbi:MBL fold metallo-hydrolase [Aquimarina sp. W85]|uniref:MBL fold metallo-hydrolase n=1 Tax=Aquimarina rhodophyticola TaxID=3342246 RepID=UPI00366F38AC
MDIQLIRSATLKITYAGSTILIDPMLAAKGTFESFAGIQKNPICDLTMSIEEVLDAVTLVLITHMHEDHFDTLAKASLSKDIPIFCQPADLKKIQESNFIHAKKIDTTVQWKGITISRTGGVHGSGEIAKHMGAVSGFVLQAENEPTTYIVGDSIWVDQVDQAIKAYEPQVIVTNSGGAYIPGHEITPILMNEAETIKILKRLPEAHVVAVHLEALDHCTVTRASLKRVYAIEKSEIGSLYLPVDGEVISFN